MRADYVKSWEEFELLPGALEAICRLTNSGRELIVVTNQSAIAQKLISRADVEAIHSRLAALVEQCGGRIKAFLVCPHGADERCLCRKPAPGLFFQARDRLGVDLADSIVVGDQVWDVQAARAAGCNTVLVRPSRDADTVQQTGANYVVADLAAAADLICGN